MLTTYQEVRDRIYQQARRHGLRPDWAESTRSVRLLLLYDSAQTVVARSTVPLRDITVAKLERLRDDLAPVLRKGVDGMRLSVLVKREKALDTGAWVWTALPQGYPGSAGGRTITELHEEVEALKHFFTGGDPETDIAVDYFYELPGVAPEVLIDYRHGRSARDEAADELRRANAELSAKARATATALRRAGLSIRDSAALMGLSKSRFEQICSS